MKIPSSLKIGAITYTVRLVEPDEIDAKFAECDYQTNTISIIKTLPQQQQEETLIHEILHALNSKLNETTCEFLAQGIYQVFVDNKLLRK